MAAIQRVTEVPGPKARAILARRESSVARGVHHATPVVAAACNGAIIEDVDGNRFLDFAAGIGTINVGHSNPAIIEAVRRQLDDFIHTCFQVAPYESYISCAERLARLTPGNFPKKTIFLNSGAEAVENAVKIARHATGRPAILCFEDGFHGRTLGALALTSKVEPYKTGMGPFDAPILRVPYAYCYRCSYGRTYPSCQVACVDMIEEYFARHVDPQTIAAVIVEPVLGEGGFVVPPHDFLRKLATLCQRHGILTIADEIQTGMGRTGRMFACEHYGFVPDMLLAAKSLASGIPLSAVIGRAEIMDSPPPGGLGGTFAGNPLALAAAHAVLDVMEQGDLLQRAEAIGQRAEAYAKDLAVRFPLVGDVRRLGAMVGIELVRDRNRRVPAKDETNDIVRLACAEGLVLIPSGTHGNVIRLLPPLVISDEELDEGLNVLGRCVQAVVGTSAPAASAYV